MMWLSPFFIVLLLAASVDTAPTARTSICNRCACLNGGIILDCSNLDLTSAPVLTPADLWLMRVTRIINLSANKLTLVPSTFWLQFQSLHVARLGRNGDDCVRTHLPPHVLLKSGVICSFDEVNS